MDFRAECRTAIVHFIQLDIKTIHLIRAFWLMIESFIFLVNVDCRVMQDGWCGWKNVTSNSWLRGQSKHMAALIKQVDNDQQWKNNTGANA